MFSFIKYMASRIREEEDGVALSEYLVLLGLLVAGVLVAVGTFGTNLGVTWTTWATWIAGLDDRVPTTTTTPPTQ